MIKKIGHDKLNISIKKELFNIKLDVRLALIAIGQFIKGKALPLTPADTSVLRQSIFVSNPNDENEITIGYTAKYAPYVHEMPESNNFSTPGTSSGFLSKAVMSSTNDIGRIIANRLKR